MEGLWYFMLFTPFVLVHAIYEPTNALNKNNKIQIINYSSLQASNPTCFDTEPIPYGVLYNEGSHIQQHASPGNDRLFRTITILKFLLTPWCRVLLEQLTGLQLVKKLPEFHGTRRFITALTSV